MGHRDNDKRLIDMTASEFAGLLAAEIANALRRDALDDERIVFGRDEIARALHVSPDTFDRLKRHRIADACGKVGRKDYCDINAALHLLRQTRGCEF